MFERNPVNVPSICARCISRTTSRVSGGFACHLGKFRLVVDLGFETRNRLVVSMDLGQHGYDATASAIYFLLRSGEISKWHRVDADEIWHWYAGAPLELSIAEDGGPARRCAGPGHREG